MNRHCFTVVTDDLTDHETFRVAKVIEHENGYYPLGKKDYSDPNELDKFCGSYKFLNSKLKLSNEEIDKIILSSMKLGMN